MGTAPWRPKTSRMRETTWSCASICGDQGLISVMVSKFWFKCNGRLREERRGNSSDERRVEILLR